MMTRRFRLSVLACAGMLAIPATRGGSAQPTEPTMTATDAVGQVITGRFHGPAGGRAWRLYVPSSYVRSKPPMLMVLLHGCTQTAADIARGSQMDQVAEELGFLVLYPEQPVEANPRTCWNWFDAAHQARDAGEPAILAGLVADVLTQFPADPTRVHIVGISAGAAMAGLVAVAYPERFATLTSLSGVPWQAARNVGAALSVMQRGAGDAVPSADAVLLGMGAHSRALPVLVIHGGADAVVAFRNADETATQWVGVHDRLRANAGAPPLQATPEQVTQDNAYTVRRVDWRDASGAAVVTRVRIDELGHAWAGGSTAGTFTDAKGPDVSRMVATFCQQHRLP
ncbi:MAG: PHB depolymerase family esterase [Gemmatimonadaceae bacterium]|nr:PHB depolymerase family esterase [Gemmatimonadaceae bacterium]